MMINKKSVDRKWVAAAVAAYLLIMGDLLPSLAIASLLPAQHVADAPGGSEGGRTGSPRKALRGGFKLKGTIHLDSHVSFGKYKKQRAVASRSLRMNFTVSPPSPHSNDRRSQDPRPRPCDLKSHEPYSYDLVPCGLNLHHLAP